MDLFGEYEMGNPELAIVIVTFNTRDLLLQCLHSVTADADSAGRAYRVIVVDNASTDGTAAAVRAAFPSVDLIENPANVGLAPALNQGLRACADATYVLLMNSDIKVRPGTLVPMLDYLDRHPQVAGVSGQLINPDGSPQKFRTSFGLVLFPERFDRIFRLRFFGTTFHLGRRAMYNEDQVGGFDEYFFFFNEDLDWSIRAHRRGLVFYYLPNLPVIHYVGQGRAQNRYRILSELYPANLYLYAKFYGRSVARLVYFVQRAELLGKLAHLRLRDRANSSEADAYRAALEKQRRYMGSVH
jgi:GT2 family glycosyltransferase